MTTIGQRLKEAREVKRLTLEKVFEATRIRVQYLRALEADDLSMMPSPVQARGYLRNYAEYLELDVAKMLDELREVNAQKPLEVVIGPTDAVEAQPAQAAEITPAAEAAPAEDSMALLIKPKPARRKKTESSPDGDSFPAPKRRRSKKGDLELKAFIPVEPTNIGLPENYPDDAPDNEVALTSIAETAQEVPSQADGTDAETTSAPLVSDSAQPVELPAVEDRPSDADVSDKLWQTWRNRLASVLAARNKRQTLVPKETVIAEIESKPVLAETEPPPSADKTESLSAEGSTKIFQEIGEELRKRRELLSLHIEEVERNTHVKAHYLDALERGAMGELPSTVQTRGMLANYATFLDLDVDALLLRFADALQARYRERNPQKPARKSGQPIVANLPPMRSFIAGDLIFGVGIVVLLVGFAIWGVSRVLEIQGQRDVQPTAPSISEILLASPNPASYTATPTFLSVEAFPGQPTETIVIPTLAADVNVQVN
ncbi:MAG: helix-turn-helix domain-containing protein, partial [Byssovorax cruenta]